MNKLILLLFGIAATAFCIQFFGIFDITGTIFNLPTILSLGTGSLLADPLQFFKSNGETLITALTSLGGCTAGFSFIYNNLKTKATQALNTAKSVNIEQSKEILNLQSEQDAAVTQITDLTKQRDEAVAQAESAASNAEKQIKSLQSQVGQLENEKNEIKKMFNYVDNKVSIIKNAEPIP